MKGFDGTRERNARLAEQRAAKAEERAERAESRAEHARRLMPQAESPYDHERAVRHVMAHEFAAEAQRHAADLLRARAAQGRKG